MKWYEWMWVYVISNLSWLRDHLSHKKDLKILPDFSDKMHMEWAKSLTHQKGLRHVPGKRMVLHSLNWSHVRCPYMAHFGSDWHWLHRLICFDLAVAILSWQTRGHAYGDVFSFWCERLDLSHPVIWTLHPAAPCCALLRLLQCTKATNGLENVVKFLSTSRELMPSYQMLPVSASTTGKNRYKDLIVPQCAAQRHYLSMFILNPYSSILALVSFVQISQGTAGS